MIRLIKPSTVALVVLAAATIGAAAADEPEIRFERYESQELRCTVLLPSRPARQTKPLGDGFVEHGMYAKTGPEFEFVAKCLEIPEQYVAGKDPQKMIQVYRDGSRHGKTIVADRVLTVGRMEYPAREYRLEAMPGFHVRERLVLVGGRMYTLYVGAEDKALLDSDQAEQFFDSFEPASDR